MKILDLDLDFFVSDIARWRSENDPRLDPTEFRAWSEREARAFLEDQCLLSSTCRIPGTVVREHREAFP